MVVLDWSVWFFPRMRLRDFGVHIHFVLLRRVFDVLSLCFLLVLLGCPQEVHLVQPCLHTKSRLRVIVVLPGLSCVPLCVHGLPRRLQ